MRRLFFFDARTVCVAILTFALGTACFAGDSREITIKFKFYSSAEDEIKPKEFERQFRDELLLNRLKQAWPNIKLISNDRPSSDTVIIDIKKIDTPGLMHQLLTGASLGIVTGKYEMSGVVTIIARGKRKSNAREISSIIDGYCFPSNTIGTCTERRDKMINLFAEKTALVILGSLQ